MKNRYNVIITGSTGMLGKACLLESIKDERIEKILLINRSKINISSPKIKEILVKNYNELESFKDELNDYDACFHCMGVSAVGMTEENYLKITFDATKTLVDLLYNLNPNIVFNYISGTGTDSSEKSSIMWARVKGKTENYVLNKGFKNAYAFRPGLILPENGVKPKSKVYFIVYLLLNPFLPLFKLSSKVSTSTKIGRAMINTLFIDYPKNHLENSDISQLGDN